VLLVGMQLPPNYGARYAQDFNQAFADVAKQHKVAYLPFLLEGMAEKRDLFQQDQLHPTAEAQPIILDTVWRALQPMLKRSASTQAQKAQPG